MIRDGRDNVGLRILHLPDVVCAYLVAESAASAVDHHAHLTLASDAEARCGLFIEDVINYLHLNEVVTCSDSAQLLSSTGTGARRDHCGIGTGEACACLGVCEVILCPDATLDSPACTLD